jgi:hypothetical protein
MSTLQTNEVRQKTLTRKPYHKPHIEQVRLRLDEAVLGSGCKTNLSGGNLGLGNSGNCLLALCFDKNGS